MTTAQVPTTGVDYFRAGNAELQRLVTQHQIDGKARNIVIFIGDGMSVSTLTAARIHDGQRRGVDGESFIAEMDRLTYTALVKTYSHDGQVSDSAPTATAILAGVKTRNGVIGIGPEAVVDDCAASSAFAIPSLFGIAEEAGRATGIVSTAGITHATPAAAYAHTAQRDWEADSDMPRAASDAGCIDIARQMLEWPHGDGLDVVLGGGRANFQPTTQRDPEYSDRSGRRADGRDLIATWQKANPLGKFAWNMRDFTAVDPAATSKLLGLFEPNHMQYEADRHAAGGNEPSLADMTRKAIAMLDRNASGYVLMVEAGRIDHAHHGGNARRALEDTIALDEALKAALELVDLSDTLVVVTSDHSHTLTISGYPERGNPILGPVANPVGQATKAKDGSGYTTLGYANGPGAVTREQRSNPPETDTAALDYIQQALVPLNSETHAGDDVVARAAGPMAHLFKGTIEQNTIFHILKHAAGL